MYIVISGPLSLKNDTETINKITEYIKKTFVRMKLDTYPSQPIHLSLKTRYKLLYEIEGWAPTLKLDQFGTNLKWRYSYSKPKVLEMEENQKKQEVTTRVLVRQTFAIVNSGSGIEVPGQV